MRTRSIGIAALAVLALLGGLLALRFAIHGDEVIGVAPRRDAGVAVAQPPPRPPIVAPPPPTRAAPDVPAAPTGETIDSCRAMPEPDVPDGYESITSGGITVAWQAAPLRTASDAPLRPGLLAHAAAGIVEEAAQVTGTTARATLVVIVDVSADELRTRTHAPAWADGLFDGAVRLGAVPSADLGVRLETLRHEIMHAQLHAMVGCMPAWFDEGLAMWFGNEPPLHEWLGLLRRGELLDTGTLVAPFAAELDAAHATEMYAQAFAMAMTLADDIGGAVRALAAAPDRLHLWARPDGAILDALADRLFGVPRGAALDARLAGPVCCTGLRRGGETRCRAPAAVKEGRTAWTDRSTTPAASCSTRW